MSNKAKPMSSENRYRLLGSAVYYTLQGFSIIGWWVSLWQVPDSRIFRTSRMIDTAFMDLLWTNLSFWGWVLWSAHRYSGKDPSYGYIQPLTWDLGWRACIPRFMFVERLIITNGEGWAATLCMLLMCAGSFFAAWTAGLENNPLFRGCSRSHSYRTHFQNIPSYEHILVYQSGTGILGCWYR